MRSARLARWRGDDGSILPLVAAFTGLALALILVVVAASSLYLAHERLYALADGAALAGAQSFRLEDVAFDGQQVTARLDPAAVRRAATGFLAVAPQSFDGVVLESATTEDGVTATATVSAVWRPPLVAPFLPDGLRLEATSVARTAFR